jgi:hypothetical protein
LTSASRLQASHVAVTARTPFSRMFARVLGGPKLFRIVMRAVFRRPSIAAFFAPQTSADC